MSFAASMNAQCADYVTAKTTSIQEHNRQVEYCEGGQVCPRFEDYKDPTYLKYVSNVKL